MSSEKDEALKEREAMMAKLAEMMGGMSHEERVNQFSVACYTSITDSAERCGITPRDLARALTSILMSVVINHTDPKQWPEQIALIAELMRSKMAAGSELMQIRAQLMEAAGEEEPAKH